MRHSRTLCFCLSLIALSASADPGNPNIDADRHLRLVTEAMQHRETRRVDEAEFVRLSTLPGAVIFDARSPDSFERLHVKGAVNLPYSDIALESLSELLPDRETTILIYCDNNFVNADPAIMRTKLASFALNLPTFSALYEYGYRNLYELAPAIDPTATAIPLEGSALDAVKTQQASRESPPR